jgi:cell wall-associated NlpC family hydrolase
MTKQYHHWSEYLNIPYKHLGRDRKGIDCYGLSILYAKEVMGIDLPDWWYEEDWSKKEGGYNYFTENCNTYAERVEHPIPNDMVLFFTDMKTKVVNHIGIFVEFPDKVIQALKHGVTLTSLKTPVVKAMIEGYYRLRTK